MKKRPRFADWIKRIHSLRQNEPKNLTQLISILRTAERNHLLGPGSLRMIEGVLQVADMQVRDVMIPRAQMVVIEKDAPPQQIVEKIIEAGHSRYPVVGENRDEVVGILLAKDLLRHVFSNVEPFNLSALLRPPIFIPESKRLNVLLDEFRLKRYHMAIVADEYGSISGIITIEDVLEEIVGEIEDEFDEEDHEEDIVRLNETQYAVKALLTIEDFNQAFHTHFSDEEFDTIGGLVTQHFGHVPKRGETITIKEIEFKVLYADKRRVRLLRVCPSSAKTKTT